MLMQLNVVFVCLQHAKCCTDKPASQAASQADCELAKRTVAKAMPLKSSRLPQR